LISDSGVFDIDVAVATAVRGRLCHIDAGVATFFKRKKIRSEKMFLIMATVGFDADVVRRMHLTRKGHIRRWSYLKPILTSLRKYRYPRIRVEPLGSVDGVNEPKFEEPLTVAWALLFNLPRYAAGLSIETLADETDGSLDFCGLSRGSHANGIRYLLGVIFRKHTGWSDVKRMRGKHFRLSSVLPVAVQLDGDYAGRLPVEIRVEPLRVTLRLPPLKNPGNF
jgi:diacylglycerol kinase family enzyme